MHLSLFCLFLGGGVGRGGRGNTYYDSCIQKLISIIVCALLRISIGAYIKTGGKHK